MSNDPENHDAPNAREEEITNPGTRGAQVGSVAHVPLYVLERLSEIDDAIERLDAEADALRLDARSKSRDTLDLQNRVFKLEVDLDVLKRRHQLAMLKLDSVKNKADGLLRHLQDNAGP